MANDVLVIGYGNPGRRDDGLGPALIAELEKDPPAGVTLDADYQLNVEDALSAVQHGTVVFVDAAAEGDGPFAFARVSPGQAASFSTHSVQPSQVVELACGLLGGSVRAYVLAIRGYEFEGMGESLSDGARGNLKQAVEFLRGVLRRRDFESAAGERDGTRTSRQER